MSETKLSAAIPLAVNDHSRDIVGMTYVYPVVSRRAGGVSVGINLNPNNACNWRCIYCQVPDLQRGNAPPLDLQQLERELDTMLDAIVNGSFMEEKVPAEARRLNDIALSGNGEPTSSRQFAEVIGLIGRIKQKFGLGAEVKLVLISNGSQMYRPEVQQALEQMREFNGEVWFKLDRAPVDDYSFVNQVALRDSQVVRHAVAAATRCPTWIQTCMFALDGQLPDETAIAAYLDLLRECLQAGAPLQGVLLYGLARPSTQAEAPRLSAAPRDWMENLAQRIETMGLPVKLSL
ncbi:radical SAM protein [Chitinimonas lacunae]|uniref:Radical SAM protein n=1 Tax=Chitinimonas lacunae TaxID=1963018 RepID=A0ABV8MIB7_9NEIS